MGERRNALIWPERQRGFRAGYQGGLAGAHEGLPREIDPAALVAMITVMVDELARVLTFKMSRSKGALGSTWARG